MDTGTWLFVPPAIVFMGRHVALIIFEFVDNVAAHGQSRGSNIPLRHCHHGMAD
jgi:hypothetical protein